MPLITTGKAARLAGVTRETIQNKIKKGELEAFRLPGGHYRLEESQVRAKLCRVTLEDALT